MFYALLAGFAALAVILDQVSKYLVVTYIPYAADVSVWPGVFHLTHVHNTGMAFSMLEGGRWFFLIVTLAALVLIVLTVKKKWLSHTLSHWSLAAVAGGAIGNLIDRVLHGYVVDMIEVDFMRFAVFNVADCFVVCGGILLGISVLFLEDRPKEDAAHDSAD